jgi:hypothetical protein
MEMVLLGFTNLIMENGLIWFYIFYHGQNLRNENDIIGSYTRYNGQLAFEGH